MAATTFDITKDLESLTNFKRNSAGVMKQIRKTGRPVALTVKGKAKAVLMDPAYYQDLADRLHNLESTARSIEQWKTGKVHSFEDVFAELEAEA